MRIRHVFVAAAAAALIPAVVSAGAVASAATTGATPGYRHVCAANPAPGHAACLALLPNAAHSASPAAVAPASPSDGYQPQDLQSAYNIAVAAAASGRGQTVAVVDAYDDPSAASDLSYYRHYFGLPACTTANGCFQKVNEDGAASPLPVAAGTSGWATEESLDLDMVSAICPNCHLILVEASDTTIADLGTGVDAAVSLGAGFISNSYGGSESAGEAAEDSYYDHPGVAVTVSAGDSGYGVEYPAASPYVTAVGGTSLYRDKSVPRLWRETVWGDGQSGTDGDGTGSGCSAYEPKPSWQTDPGCALRTVADVSAVADPDTGVWAYDTYDEGGWFIVGGTSAASPIIAAMYALAGTPGGTDLPAQYPYEHPTQLNDVTTGSNGSCGTTSPYLCQGEVGYDGPTGLGTPNGTNAFKSVDNVVTVHKPSRRLSVVGRKITPLQLSATDSLGGQSLTYSATGLPTGLTISPSGKITGKPSKLQYETVQVTATDNTGASGTMSFVWSDEAKGAITSGLSSKRCVTARGGSDKSGTAIEIAKCTGGSSQRWIVIAGASDRDAIELASGDKSSSSENGCMGVKDASTKSGAKVATYKCTATTSLQWTPGSHGHLTGKHSGKCLSDPSSGPNGTQLTIAGCASENREHWNLP